MSNRFWVQGFLIPEESCRDEKAAFMIILEATVFCTYPEQGRTRQSMVQKAFFKKTATFFLTSDKTIYVQNQQKEDSILLERL